MEPPLDWSIDIYKLETDFLNSLKSAKIAFFDADDLIDLFYFEIEKHELDTAKKVLEVGRHIHPKVKDFYFLEGIFDAEESHWEDALSKYEQYKSVDNADWNYLCFQALIHLGKNDLADDAAMRVCECAEDVQFYMVDIIEQFQEAADYELALKYLEKASEIEGLNKEELLKYAHIASYMAQPELACQFADRVIADNPYDEDAWYEEAHALVENEKYEEALEKLEYVYAINPDNIRAILENISICIARRQLKEARELVQRAREVELEGKEYEKLVRQLLDGFEADITYWLGDYKTACKLYGKLHKRGLLEDNQVVFYANSKWNTHRWRDAKDLLRNAIKKDDNNLEAHQALAFFHRDEGWYTAAIGEVKKCIEIAPQRLEYYVLCATLHLEGYKYPKGLEFTKNMIKLFPNEPQAYILQAEMQIGLNHPRAAKMTLKKGMAVNPYTFELYKLMFPSHVFWVDGLDEDNQTKKVKKDKKDKK